MRCYYETWSDLWHEIQKLNWQEEPEAVTDWDNLYKRFYCYKTAQIKMADDDSG